MSTVTEKIKELLKEIPKEVTLIAVSKTQPANVIKEAYNGGYRIFGENRPQELKEKYALLPKDIEWHMIGQLQKNKVKYIAPFVSLIHSVDSLALLKVIEKEAKKNERKIPFLLQLKVAKEETKSGLSYEEAQQLLGNEEFKSMTNVKCCGIMGMATFTDDQEIIRREFSQLKEYFNSLRENFFPQSEDFTQLSMGMSGDYHIAIEEGSTLIRVGSQIFGKR